MRSFTFSLTGGALSLKWLLTITRRDGVLVRLTDAQRDLTISGHTWTAEPGLTITNVEYYADGTVSNAQIALALRDGGVVTAPDIAIGKYRSANLSMQIVNFLVPALGADTFTGYLGAVTLNTRGLATFEARGQLILGGTVAAETYQATDLAELGDYRSHIEILPPDVMRSTFYTNQATDPFRVNNVFMRVRIGSAGNPSDYANLYWECTSNPDGFTASSAPTYTGNVGDVITDGTAQFTARNAWLRYAQVGALTGDYHFTVVNLVEPRAVDGWFKLGQALIRSGNGAGLAIELRDWTQAGLVAFAALPVTGLIAPGDWLELIPGYDKTAKTAFSKFDNIINLRGDPFAPAAGALLSPSGGPVTPAVPGPSGGSLPVIY